MKKLIVYLLMAVLLISITGLCSCRSIKKDRSRADSTTSLYEQQKQEWDNQVTQEFVMETNDLASIQSLLPLPALRGVRIDKVPGLTRFPWMPSFQKVLRKNRNPQESLQIENMYGKPGYVKFTVRSTAKESGEQLKTRSESRHVVTSARTISKGRNWLSIALVVVGVLVIAFIYLRSKRGR